MDLKTTMWICEVCGIKGNAISFLAKLRDMDRADARAHIEQRYGAGPTAAIGDLEEEVRRNLNHDVEVERERVRPSDGWVIEFVRSWEGTGQHAIAYMESRGFSREVLDGWYIGYDHISQRVAIPVYDVAGELVGFKARSIDPERHPRYLILGDAPGRPSRYGFDPYHKSHHVFGLHAYAHQQQHICVIEGELNVVAMRSKTPEYRSVGVAGSEFSEIQRRLIVEHCSGATVWFDGDAAGAKGTHKVVEMLSPYMPVSVAQGSEHDAADADPAEIREIIESSASSLSHLIGLPMSPV